jgi:hypothetical protein
MSRKESQIWKYAYVPINLKIWKFEDLEIKPGNLQISKSSNPQINWHIGTFAQSL